MESAPRALRQERAAPSPRPGGWLIPFPRTSRPRRLQPRLLSLHQQAPLPAHILLPAVCLALLPLPLTPAAAPVNLHL